MCCVSDGISHLDSFFCQECGFELPASCESEFIEVCVNCEKEIVFPLSHWSVKPTPKLVSLSRLSSIELPF